MNIDLQQLLLPQDTFAKFGYWPQDLSLGSTKMVIHKCGACAKGKETEWRYFIKGKSILHQECKTQRTKQTNLTKYGVEHPSQCREIQEKTRQTNRAKYGVDYPWQHEDVRKKRVQTNIKKFGVSYPMQSADVRKKSQDTSLKHFGVEHPAQNEEVVEKMKQTNLQRLGVERPNQSELVRRKRIQNWLRKRDRECDLEQVYDVREQYFREYVRSQGDELIECQQEGKVDWLLIKCREGCVFRVRRTLYYCPSFQTRCPYCKELKREKQVHEILKQIDPSVEHYPKLQFLGKLKADFCIRKLKLVIEYDGEQHYKIIEYFGGEEGLKYRQKCDERKNCLCQENGWKVLRIKFNDVIDLPLIKNRIERLTL